MSAGRAILVVNAGSSSLKFAIYDAGAASTVAARGEVATMDRGGLRARARNART